MSENSFCGSIRLGNIDLCFQSSPALAKAVDYLVSGFPANNNNVGYKLLFSLSSNSALGKRGFVNRRNSMDFLNLERADISSNSVSFRLASNHLEVVSAALGCGITVALGWNKGILFHAAGLKFGNKSMIFLAKSGGGKSTIVENCRMGRCLHDDKIAVMKSKNSWIANSVPLLDNSGKTVNTSSGILAGLFLIKKSKKLSLLRLRTDQAFAGLASQTYEPTGHKQIRQLVAENLMDLVAEVPVYRLGYVKGYDVGKLLEKHLRS